MSDQELLQKILTTVETRFDGLESRFEKLETRFDGLESRLAVLETRLDRVEARLESLETRVGTLEARLDQSIADTKAMWLEVAAQISDIRQGQHRIEGDMRAMRHATVGTIAVLERAQAAMEDRVARLEASQA